MSTTTTSTTDTTTTDASALLRRLASLQNESNQIGAESFCRWVGLNWFLERNPLPFPQSVSDLLQEIRDLTEVVRERYSLRWEVEARLGRADRKRARRGRPAKNVVVIPAQWGQNPHWAGGLLRGESGFGEERSTGGTRWIRVDTGEVVRCTGVDYR